jgi:hypothetical protein
MAFCPVAFGQKLSFGVVGGTNLTDDFRTLRYPFMYLGNTYTNLTYSDSRSFIFGPMLEIGLPNQWSIEVDALRRALKYTFVTDFPGSAVGAPTGPFHVSAPTWQFPVLLKYRFPMGKVQPFIAAGPSFRSHSDSNGARLSHRGITGGAGVEVSAGRLHVAPSVRYTRWASDDHSFQPTIQNQVELLIGLRYATNEHERRAFGNKAWFGVVAGVPLTHDFPRVSNDIPEYTGVSTRFADFRSVAGLLAEIGITDKLSLEVNGLYRRLHLDTGPDVVVTWEIPVLAKYKFSYSKVKPFVELGPSFRPTGNLNAYPSHYGISSGAGFEVDGGRVRFTPTLRYTRWAADNRPFGSPQQPFTKLDQVEFLVGISF